MLPNSIMLYREVRTMNTKTLLIVILSIGVSFNMIGRAIAADADCSINQPHVVSSPVCRDLPMGPRFKVRR